MLSIELRDRTALVVHLLDQQVAAGAREDEALTSLFAAQLPEVAAHGERVARYAHSVARALDLDHLLPELEIAARFHDVGKLAMPEALMSKPSPLTRGENAIMRQHAVLGAEILESTRELASAAPAVRSSHEWFEGNGYPEKVTGTAIPLTVLRDGIAHSVRVASIDRTEIMRRPRLQ